MRGADKPSLPVAGRPMLHRVLAAVADAVPRVVVGPYRDGLPPDVRQVREEPPGTGPVAAIAAGLSALPPGVETVAVLAGDLPFLTGEVVDALRLAQSTVDGAVLADGSGRAQLLCAVWKVSALRDALVALGDPAGQSVRRLVAGLRLAGDAGTTRDAGPVLGPVPPPWYDCDTEDDLRQAEEWSR